MAWLRLDDGFLEHPKIIGLSDRELRTWLGVLLYCSRYRTRGTIPAGARGALGLTTKTARRFLELDLLADNNGELEVHDFEIYNGETIADKVTAYLETHPDASANEVCRNVGGKREIVLSEIARQRGSRPVPDGSRPVPEAVPREPKREPVSGSESGSESGSRARAPVPNPSRSDTAAAAAEPTNPAAADDQLLTRLSQLGWGDTELELARHEPTRARAWLNKADRDATSSPGGYAWSGFSTGGWPGDEPDHEQPKRPLIDTARDLIRQLATEYPDDALLDELGILERKRDEQLTDDQRAELLELAQARRKQADAA